uniref:Uncharacterized protein n=1 Tax=Bracon brevicornis TaxID=1563983 RepID=A0A6V7J6D5_9HYME
MEFGGNYQIPYNIEAFQKELTDSVLEFLQVLYTDDHLSREMIQRIIDHHRKLLNGLFQTVKNNVQLVLQTLIKDQNQIEGVLAIMTQYQQMYRGLETDHLRVKELKKSGALISSVEYIIGQGYRTKERKGALVVTPTDRCIRFVPMRDVLQAFLEMPGVLNRILGYCHQLQANTTPVIENILQAQLWKEKILPLFQGREVLPLTLYYDDLQTQDFGTHSSDGKLGAVYFSIPCLPAEFQSQLENIFTALIFYSHDQNAVPNEEVFKPVMDELKYLADNGINVTTDDGKEKRIYFALTSIIGDNLALHSMMGFVTSFAANYSCRICRVHKDEMIKQTQELKSLIRNRENYQKDVLIDNVSQTGIKENCIFNDLDTFHCVENLYIDLMHEIELGWGNRAMAGLISILVARKRITYAVLQNRIDDFHYGYYEQGNQPPLISKTHIDSKKLPFSAAECLSFIRHFGFMAMDIINYEEDRDIWEFYRILIEVVSILTDSTINMDLLPYLDNLVSSLIQCYVNLFPQWNITVKLHHFLHIRRILSAIGPLSRLTCYRFEAKHKSLRRLARTSHNRRNIPLTVTERSQITLAFRFLRGKGLVQQFETSGQLVKRIAEIEDHEKFLHILPPHTTSLTVLASVTISGTHYAPYSVVVIDLGSEYPVFGKIVHVVLAPESTSVQFIVKKYVVREFHSTFNSYEVVLSDEWAYVHYAALITYVPTIERLGIDGKSYILHRHHL